MQLDTLWPDASISRSLRWQLFSVTSERNALLAHDVG